MFSLFLPDSRWCPCISAFSDKLPSQMINPKVVNVIGHFCRVLVCVCVCVCVGVWVCGCVGGWVGGCVCMCKIIQLLILDLQSLIYTILSLQLKVYKKGLNGQIHGL